MTGRKPSVATVTRRDLAKALKEKSGGSITEHDRWIQDFIEVLSHQISQSGRVEIRGFGSFSLSTIKAHTTVSPAAVSRWTSLSPLLKHTKCDPQDSLRTSAASALYQATRSSGLIPFVSS